MSATQIKGHLGLVSLFDNPPFAIPMLQLPCHPPALKLTKRTNSIRSCSWCFEVLRNLWISKLFISFNLMLTAVSYISDRFVQHPTVAPSVQQNYPGQLLCCAFSRVFLKFWWEELENIVDKMQRNFHCFWQKDYVCCSQKLEWVSFILPHHNLLLLSLPNCFFCLLKTNEYRT